MIVKKLKGKVMNKKLLSGLISVDMLAGLSPTLGAYYTPTQAWGAAKSFVKQHKKVVGGSIAGAALFFYFINKKESETDTKKSAEAVLSKSVELINRYCLIVDKLLEQRLYLESQKNEQENKKINLKNLKELKLKIDKLYSEWLLLSEGRSEISKLKEFVSNLNKNDKNKYLLIPLMKLCVYKIYLEKKLKEIADKEDSFCSESTQM